MPRNVVALHKVDEILWRVTRQSRARKMRILRDKVLMGAMNIGEITTPTATNSNFIARPFCMIKHQDRQAALHSSPRTHEASRPRSDYDYIIRHRRRFKAVRQQGQVGQRKGRGTHEQ